MGYALSRFSFRGKVVVAGALFVTQMLPEALLVVPIFGLFRQLNLLNSLPGLIMVNAAFVLPWSHSSSKVRSTAFPASSTRPRGGRCAAVRRVGQDHPAAHRTRGSRQRSDRVLPRMEEYVFAVTFIFDESLRPASVGLAGYIGELSTPLQTVMGVALIYTLPAVIFYLFTQRYVVSGLIAGGVKG